MFFSVLIQEEPKKIKAEKPDDGCPGGGIPRGTIARLRRGSNSAARAFRATFRPPFAGQAFSRFTYTATFTISPFKLMRGNTYLWVRVSEQVE